MKIYIKSALDSSNIPEEHKGGDCFIVAYRQCMNNPGKYTLVHGVITGRGALEGIQFAHAWVETDTEVIDRTLPEGLQQLPKEAYYSFANVVLTKKYSFNDVLEKSVEFGTYGPWDSVFDNYY